MQCVSTVVLRLKQVNFKSAVKIYDLSCYVTSILITRLTFAMFLLKLSTLSAAIFLFVSLVLSVTRRRPLLGQFLPGL